MQAAPPICVVCGEPIEGEWVEQMSILSDEPDVYCIPCWIEIAR